MSSVALHGAVTALNVLDARSLLATFGVIGIAVVLFAETGLLVGLFLPGDSLLFTAGVLSATSARSSLHLSLGWVLAAAAAGALIGSQTGYVLGRTVGVRLLDRPDRPRLVGATTRAREFLDRYGVGKALVLARFVPLVRTVINPLVGALGVGAPVFTRWQLLGGLLWTQGVVLVGWQLGSHIHNIDHYLLPAVVLIVAVSLIPVVIELRRDRRHRKAVA
jgi:membrane-associated protein